MKSGSSLIIENSLGKYLLQQKTETYPVYPYFWSLIGGGIEGDETPLETVIRETNEELNLALENPKKIGHLEIDNTHQYIFYLKINLEESKIKIGEGRYVKHFSKEEIKKLNILPHTRAMLDFFFNKINNY